jgi:hypothetical protein
VAAESNRPTYGHKRVVFRFPTSAIRSGSIDGV